MDSNGIDLLDPANGPSIAFTAKSGINGSTKRETGTIKYLKDRTVSKNNSNGDKYGEVITKATLPQRSGERAL